MKHTRREFIVGSGCLALSGAAYAANFNNLSLMNLFASASPGNDANYKALVCIFLFGGNDANNMVIPYDDNNPAHTYSAYASARTGAPFLIANTDLLQINTSSQGAFGLPNRGTYNTTGIQSLYNPGNLAFVVNVGTLVQPLDRATYLSSPSLRPDQLFSHSNQQAENQNAVPQGTSQTGWGGRLADRVYSTELFPLQISVAGVNIYQAAQRTQTQQLVVPSTGLLNQALRYDPPRQATLDAVNAALALPDTNRLRLALNSTKGQGLATRSQLGTDPPIVTTFPNTALGNQLKQIAKFIYLRDVLSSGGPMRRQIFFASLGGFDTHANQNANQGALLTQLSAALLAFHNEMVAQGIDSQVTTFTQSDFSRTFKIGAQASGTDHAWGSHQMVMGGAVLGGDFYGTYPTLVMNGPDDTDTGANARGRWLPSTAVAQYGATLAKWFGVSDADMPLVFPNIGQFGTTDLGFMAST
jgi:uncharacterized protein (DUF1501 family)